MAIAVTALLFTLTSAGAAATSAQVPARFHGRWADTLRGCAVRGPGSDAVTIDARGWNGYEDGARVTGALPAVHGATRFDVLWSGDDQEVRQVWSLRLLNGRLYWLALMHGTAPVRQTMVRCRAR